MKKLLFFSFLILTLALGGFVSQADSAYVRKKVKPNFFMPEEKEAKRERLPSFPALEKGMLKVSDDGVVLVKKNVTTYVPSKKEKELPKPQRARESNSYARISYDNDDGMGDDFSKSSEYSAMKAAYENDLQIIAKTGKIPNNRELLENLQKMNSEVPFIVH